MMLTKPSVALVCLLVLGACTWETYQTQSGQTRLRQKYPTGTGMYYTEGAASQNPHYHGLRPVPHAVVPANQK